MNQLVGVRLEPDQVKKLDGLAKTERRSRASMLRVLFEEGLEARELVKESERVPEGRSA